MSGTFLYIPAIYLFAMIPSDVHTAITESELRQISNPQAGDAVTIAVALKEVFGGDIITAYAEEGDERPVHAVVEVGGTVFDGYGKTTIDGLHQHAMCGQTYTRPKYEVLNYENEEIRFCPSYNPELKDEIVERIRETIRDLQPDELEA